MNTESFNNTQLTLLRNTFGDKQSLTGESLMNFDFSAEAGEKYDAVVVRAGDSKEVVVIRGLCVGDLESEEKFDRKRVPAALMLYATVSRKDDGSIHVARVTTITFGGREKEQIIRVSTDEGKSQKFEETGLEANDMIILIPKTQ